MGHSHFRFFKVQVDGKLCVTYRDACQWLRLLEDDTHWNATLHKASVSVHPKQIRMLFAIIISTCYPANPLELWNKYKAFISEDILIRLQHLSMYRELVHTLEMYNEALILIMIANKALEQLGIIAPNRPMHVLFQRELQREQQLNAQQKNAYDRIRQAGINNTGGLFFWTLLVELQQLDPNKKIALTLAHSGIAATLLDGSALKLPLNMQMVEIPTCTTHDSRNTGMAKVLQVFMG